LVGRQEGHLACKNLEWQGTGVVIGLERGANDLYKVQLMLMPPSKIQNGSSFCCQLTQAVHQCISYENGALPLPDIATGVRISR